MDNNQQTTANLPALSTGAEQSAMMSPVQQQIDRATRPRAGQPTTRTPEIVDTVLGMIACGRSLMSICGQDDMPGYSTFRTWIRHDPELREAVLIAYEEHAETLDDLADDILSGGMFSTGNIIRDKERVAHLRWRLGKLNRRFRDKVQMDVIQHQPVILDLGTIMGEGGDGV